MIQVDLFSAYGDVPSYAKEGDSGMDVVVQGFSVISDDGEILRLPDLQEVHLDSLDRVLIHTGLYMAIPTGYECQVRSRSGLSLKQGLIVTNQPGTIDSGYRNECNVIITNISKTTRVITAGMRIAQFVFAPVEKCIFTPILSKDMLSPTDRGDGGFGHSGV